MPPPLDYPPQAHTDTRGLSNDSLANALVLAIINESAVPAATNPNAGNATNATKKPTGRTGDFVVDNLRYAAAQKALYAKGGVAALGYSFARQRDGRVVAVERDSLQRIDDPVEWWGASGPEPASDYFDLERPCMVWNETTMKEEPVRLSPPPLTHPTPPLTPT